MNVDQQRARDLSKGVVELKPPLMIYSFEQEHGISHTYKSMILSSNRADGFLIGGFY